MYGAGGIGIVFRDIGHTECIMLITYMRWKKLQGGDGYTPPITAICVKRRHGTAFCIYAMTNYHDIFDLSRTKILTLKCS
jgi:hypothetical protein